MHAISATAREKIEAAGGTVELLREPKVKKGKHHAQAGEARAGCRGAEETPPTRRAEETTPTKHRPAEDE